MKNIPEKIYLHIDPDALLIYENDFNKLILEGEITYCQDKINENDIEYVLAVKELLISDGGDGDLRPENVFTYEQYIKRYHPGCTIIAVPKEHEKRVQQFIAELKGTDILKK